MTLLQLKTMARMLVPGAKKNLISDTNLELILNNGARAVAQASKCLATSELVNVTADTETYDLTSILTRFLGFTEAGLWYLNSSTWKQIHPKTIKWLDENYPNWRQLENGTPRYYSVEGDELRLIPHPEDATSNGMWIHYFQAPQLMTASGHYPFGYTTEIERLIPLQEAILSYSSWKLTLTLNEGKDDYAAMENAYLRTLKEKIREINRRPDIHASKYTKFQGKAIRRG